MKNSTQPIQPCKVFDGNGNLLGVATTRKEFAALINKPVAMRREAKTFFQDGRDFYDTKTERHIWVAPEGVVLGDYDTPGAMAARRLFRAMHPEYAPEATVAEAIAA